MFRASLVFCGAATGLKFEMSDKTIIMSKREFNPIDTSVKMKDVGMTPCQKLLKREGTAR